MLKGSAPVKSVSDNRIQNDRQLSDLIAMDSPKAVIKEVTYILGLISPDIDPFPITAAFHMILDLFNGEHPGYRACNTEYHDLPHTNYVFLAMARLIHGSVIDGEKFTHQQIYFGLLAALFHDSGYIQEIEDTTGTGAKYTATHVERSMDLFARYGKQINLDDRAIADVQAIILCTNLSVDISTIYFSSDRTCLLGKIMGAADMLAQMADRIYLEKLLFLYHEFRESGVGGYEGELDLLRKTIGFFEFIAHRMKTVLSGVDRFMMPHFISRWEIHENLYQTAIEKQKQYLKQILEIPDADPRNFLKRAGIVDRINSRHGGGS